MDSLTHIVLGACIGEAMLGKKLGKKALLFGAIAQSIPDIDFIVSFWYSSADNLLAHRGFTHSILFICLLTPILALLSHHFHQAHNITKLKWFLFFVSNMLIHIFIDAFNTYGVGWLEPFSHIRISFNAVYVADPLFSLWPRISLIILLLLSGKNKRRTNWAWFGMIMPIIYLSISVFNKISTDHKIKNLAFKQHISYTRLFSTPTPFNNCLWYIVLENDSGYNIGYRSVFDNNDNFKYTYFKRNINLLNISNNNKELIQLRRFSQNFYTIEQWNDTLVFNDIRFAQQIGWVNPKAHFTFHYFLNRPGANKYVLQRGRFTGWNKSSISSLIQRIEGN